MTLPGFNYLGPGTPVIQQTNQGTKPTTYADYVAQMHDIDYLTDKEPILSDLKAIANSDNSVGGMLMKGGLIARTVADAVAHILPGSENNKTHINGLDRKYLNPEQAHQLQLMADYNSQYKNGLSETSKWIS